MAHLYHVCDLLTCVWNKLVSGQDQVANFLFSLPFSSISTAGSVSSVGVGYLSWCGYLFNVQKFGYAVANFFLNACCYVCVGDEKGS